MLYHDQMEISTAADQLAVDLCKAAYHISDGGEYDYSLTALARVVGGHVYGNCIVRADDAVEMDGSVWKEMGNQYSPRKQWWPVKPS